MDGHASLSVLMPNYNHARYIGRALTAMLHQSLPAREIIVVDDGSTDDSVPLIQAIADRNPSVRFFRNERNRGWFYSNGLALAHAQGKYIYCASADDLILPGFFERSIAMLQRFPQAALCCSFHSTLDDRTGRIDRNPTYMLERPGYLSPAQVAARCWGGGIAGHTAIMRHDALKAVGGFRTELQWHCDWFTTLVLAFRHGCCFIPDSLALIRVSPSSYSAAGSRGPEQRKVLGDLLALLLSAEYADVLPLFQSSGVLSCFGAEMVRAVIATGLQENEDALRMISQLRRQHLAAVLNDEDGRVRDAAWRLRRRAAILPACCDAFSSKTKRAWTAQRVPNRRVRLFVMRLLQCRLLPGAE